MPETSAERVDFDLEVDPAQLERMSRANPWRLRHLMYMIAVVAVLLWLGIVVAGSILAVVARWAWPCCSSSSSSAMGTGVILAWGSTTKQDALLQILAIAAEGEMPLAPAVAAFADQYRGIAAPADHAPGRPLELGSTAAGCARRLARARHS